MRLRLFEVDCIEAFREPAVNITEHRGRLAAMASG
jgi:hypothetical protein